MLEDLIGKDMHSAIFDSVVGIKEEDVVEIRLRIGRPLQVRAKNCNFQVRRGQRLYVVSKEDIDGILLRASNLSIYAINDQLVKGYVACKGGIRLGVAGEGVVDGTSVITVKNIGYIVVRVPHQIKSAADKIVDKVMYPTLKSVLVISPPCGGKTTVLRELARLASRMYNVVVIDERFELCAQNEAVVHLDVGNVEIVSGLKKTYAYQNCVRAMNPDVIVTDELFKRDEVDAVCDIVRSGVRVFASLHANGVHDVEKSEVFAPLLSAFDMAVVLSKNPVGQVKEVVMLDG